MTDLQAVVTVVIALLTAVTASVVAISKRARNGHSGRPMAATTTTAALPPPPAPPQWGSADGSGRFTPPAFDVVHQLAEHGTQNRFMSDWLERLERRQNEHAVAIAECKGAIIAVRDDVEQVGELVVRRLERIEDHLRQDRPQPPRPGPRGGRPGTGG